MSSHLLVLAAADSGGLVSSLGKTASSLGIEWPLLVAQAVCFSVVAIILWKFAFKPVLATIDERQSRIDSGLKYAEEMKAKLAQAQQDAAALVKQAQVEGTKIIDEARKTAKEFLDHQQKEAAVRANDMIAKAQQAIELEHRKMLEESRGEIARLVIVTTQRVLAKELSDAERARYNEAAAREIVAG